MLAAVFLFASSSSAASNNYLPALTQAGFTEPCGVAVDSHGDLYVSEYGGAITIFGADGSRLTSFVPTSTGSPEGVCDIAVDPQGHIYAASLLGGVVRFMPSGNQFPPTSTTTYELDSSAGTGGTIVPGSGIVYSIALDPSSNDLYVVEEGVRISTYSPTGAHLATLAEGLIPGGGYVGVGVYGVNGDIYLTDSASGKVYVLNPTGTAVLAETDGADSLSGAFTEFTFPYLAVDQADGNVLVGDIAGHHVVDEFAPTGAFVSQIGPEAGGETIEDALPSAIAVDNGASSPNQGGVYVTSLTGKVYAFGPVASALPPEATTSEATEATTNSALLAARVNPNGEATLSCRFEWGPAEGVYTTGSAPCDPNPGAGGGALAVTAEATGLAEGVTYHFHVVIETAAGTADGGDSRFTTLAETAPTVSEEIARVGKESATLEARIAPNGLATTYRFQYVEESAYVEDQRKLGPGHGFDDSQTSPGNTLAPEDFGPHLVATDISGLTPGTLYRFRVLAENSHGTTFGFDQLLTTLDSAGLPDRRGVEMVSPPDLGPLGNVRTSGATSAQLAFEASAEGSSIIYPINGGLGDATAGGDVRYLARRTDGGWASQQLSPTPLVANQGTEGSQSGFLPGTFSEDLSCGPIESVQPLPTTQGDPSVASDGATYLYLRTTDASYQLLTPAPLNPGLAPHGGVPFTVRGLTAGCSHVLFETRYEYPGLGSSGLYEWSGGQIHDVGVLPGGATGAGATGGGITLAHRSSWGALSADGSRVFFSTATSEPGHVAGSLGIFVRQDARSTFDVSASTTGAADQGAVYEGAAVDGSRVFFLANYGLTSARSNGATNVDCTGALAVECDLYEYDLERRELVDLTATTDPGNTGGAEVAGVLGLSADGSSVYFAARGRLVGGQGRSRAENLSGTGSYNVYLKSGGHLTFVGLLAARDVKGPTSNAALITTPQLWSSRVTPNGARLLFVSRENNTDYDSGGVAEAYVYDASTGRTMCVSCSGGGRVATAGAEAPVATDLQYPTQLNPPRSLSEDGSRVFFMSEEALSPGGVAGNRNLYEWKEGQVALLATGSTREARALIFADASATGDDIFLTTARHLLPWVKGERARLYDLRVGGGFPEPPTPPAPCELRTEGSCQGAARLTPITSSPTTSTYSGPPNPRLKPHRSCGKRRFRRGARCVRRQGRHAHRRREKHVHTGLGKSARHDARHQGHTGHGKEGAGR